MFLPNTSCTLHSRTDTQDIYGTYTFLPPKLKVPCGVTQMDLVVKKTSVRADSSASRGRAEEEIGLARLLFSKTVVIREGDVVEILGQVIEVSRIFPRLDILGQLDHVQVDFRKGALPA
jgi:hypothetical protein